MRVINICVEDHANFSYDNAQALRSIGVECDSFKIAKHPFNYPNESTIVTVEEMAELVNEYDVVQIMHSAIFTFPIDKPKCVWHTGTTYRINHQGINECFKGVKPIIALGEFAVLAPPNYEYVVGAVDVDKYTPDYSKTGFAHYPSNPDIKGTKDIVNMFEECGVELKYSTEKVTYEEQLERMQDCNMYVELFATHQWGKPYGSWGITALEAAAMGKIVITCHTTEEVYKKTYGETQLFIANTREEFLDVISDLTMNVNYIPQQMLTRQWVEDNHSYQATGKRVKQILEKL